MELTSVHGGQVHGIEQDLAHSRQIAEADKPNEVLPYQADEGGRADARAKVEGMGNVLDLIA